MSDRLTVELRAKFPQFDDLPVLDQLKLRRSAIVAGVLAGVARTARVGARSVEYRGTATEADGYLTVLNERITALEALEA